MKVLLVNGSPRREGNTFAALSETAKIFEAAGIETEIFWLGTKPISGCMACLRCSGVGKCAINDVVNEFLDKAEAADGFIFGTPVHYAGASGAITAFMDRIAYADMGGGCSRFYLKPAAAICTARRGGATATWDQMNKYFGIMQMPIVTSQYWNMVHGRVPGEAALDDEGMQTMRTLARNMVFMLRCKQVALENGVPLPERERGIATNFIR